MNLVAKAFAKDAFYRTVGTAVRDMRMDRGVSQSQLAEASGVSKSTVSKVEDGMGSASLFALAQFAHALDCTLDDLVPLDAL